MLRNLYIKNFILVDELSLDFHSGFSCFTGETGAGKSIVIDAISLLCSERSSTSFIRQGEDSAIIEGCFSLQGDKQAISVLEDAGFSVGDLTTFTRTIDHTGKSQARIDHRIVTFSLMQQALSNQIDIHGQKDTAYLLNSNTHQFLLDEYMHKPEIIAKVKDAYQQYDSLSKEKQRLLEEDYNQSDLDYFQFQLKEIQDADLKVDEEEELEKQEKEYHLYKNSFDQLSRIIDLYHTGIEDNFYQLQHEVQGLEDSAAFDEIKARIKDSYYDVSDVISELSNHLSNFSFSEESIDLLEQRLYTIQKLKRKYNKSVAEILSLKDELEEKIDRFSHRQESIERIDQEISEAKKAYDKVAKLLHDQRLKHAKILDQTIMESLNDLGLENAVFKTDIQEGKDSSFGSDRIEFLIAMNTGENLKPLTKTASGGELSRLMLGLKEIFTSLKGIQTVIFDEIDTGVSGAIASSIGEKMKKLSSHAQVIAVTHLAQVASFCDHHYLVSKEDINHHTVSSVKELDEKESIQQLAFISHGKITDASLKAAKELRSRSKSCQK